MSLIAWNTPFARTQFPELCVIPDTEIENAGLVLVHTSNLQGNVPTVFSLKFQSWAGCMWEDESVAPNEEWVKVPKSEEGLCTYLWEDSPWLRRFQPVKEAVLANYGELKHFILLGGNKNVEILAPELPEIEEVSEEVLTFSYKVEV